MKYTAEVSTWIKAEPSKVWEALTRPDLVKQYLFGTDVDTDWKKGSQIRWRGSWEGKAYEDKGVVLDAVPGKLLSYTYWSGMSGLADRPENYMVVTCRLSKEKGGTKLVITQENSPSKEAKEHSEGNWKMVSESIKKIVEGM